MASKGQSSRGKGLPRRADHSHPSHDRRARSHVRGALRRQARREAQAAREATNRKLRAAGTPTPWEASCARSQAVPARVKARAERAARRASLGGAR